MLLAGILALALSAVSTLATAQFRFDATVCVPFRASVYLPPNSTGPALPFLQAFWQFATRNFRAGVGLDGLILVHENAIWPGIFAEYDLGPLVLRADMGGGALLLATGGVFLRPTVVPQVDLSIRLADWLRPSVGVIAFLAPGGQTPGPRIPEVVLAYVGTRLLIFGTRGSNRR